MRAIFRILAGRLVLFFDVNRAIVKSILFCFKLFNLNILWIMRIDSNRPPFCGAISDVFVRRRELTAVVETGSSFF